ncbi:uncharacterized protein LOC119979506 isoform X6 [Scyliorhinus canicula]|uniref:uncharacterized protein LOC119979506 isoform X6 n=1 Tax=Scyliorhinus canicula TaxID=7830 RepID=UPI0018F39588|nr:uncharacterized protein LOC119979506 isoform X6 [Scyliorhinus canicula]
MMNRDKRSRRRDTPKRGSSKRMTRFTLGTFLVTRDYNKVQENLTMRASAESRGLTADLCHTSPTTCNGKVRQNMERPYLENSTRQSAKHVGFKKEMHSQRLVQTNLAYTSQSLRQPMKPLLLAAVSSHKQQSNVEHHRQKHSSSDSITDRGRSISLAASKHFVRAQERYLSNSGTLTSINFNMSFDEVKTGTSKKQKKYFAHGEENLSQIQLSSQEAGDSHFKVSASQYESLIIGSPNRPVTPGNLANVYRPSLDRRSNTLRSILKSSQTSASLHRSMLSLGDSNYKAKHASRETSTEPRGFPLDGGWTKRPVKSACFDAWARFCGQKIACQQALERRQIESLRSFFLQWRSMLQLKRGENLHLFQLCHTQTHQQTTDWPELQLFASTESSNPANSTPSSRVSRWRLVHSTENPVVQAFACWSHGKDDVFIQDGVSETCVEAENIQVSCREPRSLDGICPDETLQDWRKDTYKVQLNRIPTCSRLQDALQLWPAEPFQHHLRFSKHLPQQDCTVTLVDTEGSSDTNCSCPEQGTELRPHRLHETIPANRVDLEKAGKWLQHKVEKHLVEQHLACWVAQFRQVRRVERFHQWSLLARAFLSWSQWRQGRCRTRELIERFSFVRQCRVLLSLWKMRLLQKLEADRRCREILHQQIQKAMTQWHTYTRNRRQLYDLQAYFQSVKKQKVKLLILSNWQQKAERQRDMKIVADGMVQRRYLQAWYLVTLRIEERKQNLWAFQTGQTRQTLWRVFSWWKYCCELRCYSEYHRQLQTAQRAVHCWKQKMLLGRAIRHRHTIITQIFFRSWKETVRLFQLSYQFAVNIEERRLRLLLNAWANLVKERKTVDAQLRLMISAAQQRVMQAAFHQMVALYRKQKEVVKFYHLTLLRRSLLSWAEFVHQQKQWVLTVSSQVSVLQLRSVFVMWMNQLTLHRKLILMVQKRNEQILQKALRSWYKEMQAVRHHSRYVSQKFVSRWVLNVLARKPENLRNGVEYQAEEHYRNQLCKQFLIIWWHKTLLQQFREKKRVEEMQAIWEQWKGFTVNMLVTRGLCQQRLEGKAWQMWRRRFIQTQVSRAFAAQDDRILMSDVFTAWYSLTVVKREGAE